MTERLDPVLIDELRELMAGDFAALLDAYVRESERLLAELGGARDAADLDTLRRSAHSLKGASANIGAVVLTALCADLERQAADGARHAVADQLGRVADELREVRAAVERLREQ